VSAFVYNTAVIIFSGYILVRVIVFSIVSAGRLIGRAGERIALWRLRRSAGKRRLS
jgi:hypothetical protein